MSQDYTWWEKTVEYQYVIDNIKFFTCLAPLDGNEEKAGDTIQVNYDPLKNCETFILIEFKKDKNSISDEASKFPKGRYKKLKEDFKKKTSEDSTQSETDAHHFIVYGDKVSNGRLQLKALPYFLEEEEEEEEKEKEGISINELSQKGVDSDTFEAYLKWFIGEKSASSGTTESSSGGLANKLVAGIKDREIISCMSLEEYNRERNLNLNLNLNLDPSFTPTSTPENEPESEDYSQPENTSAPHMGFKP